MRSLLLLSVPCCCCCCYRHCAEVLTSESLMTHEKGSGEMGADCGKFNDLFFPLFFFFFFLVLRSPLETPPPPRKQTLSGVWSGLIWSSVVVCLIPTPLGAFGWFCVGLGCG
ncbi:hypothetical protein IWZ03DRAFT_378186 [Phyllosticta citriasiana]|uniref:Secreted protein n=1 Tax=Phyllosticta citriasiana TaxID=595635 RepID=A0ABR1KK57_9PEZI